MLVGWTEQMQQAGTTIDGTAIDGTAAAFVFVSLACTLHFACCGLQVADLPPSHMSLYLPLGQTCLLMKVFHSSL